jgi:hypothetical protein
MQTAQSHPFSKYAAILGNVFLNLIVAYVLVSAALAFFQVASGTGSLPGGVSLKWGLAFLAVAAFYLLAFIVACLALWIPQTLAPLDLWLARAGNRLGPFRWLALALTVLFPVWLFQFTYGGLILLGLPIRLTILALAILLAAALLPHFQSNLHLSSFIFHPSSELHLFSWPRLLIAILLSCGAVLLAHSLRDVTSYPFSLTWSEGNRLWDYSMLFGRGRYLIPAGENPSAFIDIGRQFLGGIPFIFPNLTIGQARLWQGLMNILPYFLVGLALFRRKEKNTFVWLLAGLWGCAFLSQGLLHTPIVLTAFLVALAWKRPLWLGALLVAAATVFAANSRFTWVAAPALWIGMLSLLDVGRIGNPPGKLNWSRAILLAGSGLVAGSAVFLLRQMKEGAVIPSGTIADAVTRQPLLWYRLFPNSTLGPGIFIILAVAVLPLILVLLHLILSARWTLNGWQRFAILAPLAAFLAVGLVASAKIGGGGDLHNLDMFLIGLLFAAGAAWDRLGYRWLLDHASLSPFLQASLVLLLALPVWAPLVNMRPWLHADDLSRLQTLTDAQAAKDLRVLPSQAAIQKSLDSLRANVAAVQSRGEILFMDQRQLLTFGFVTDVPLIAEYEKKYMMDQAMTGRGARVFDGFYADLAAQRFALIVSEPLRIPIKDADYAFSEENNAWVTLVAEPILCYYEPYATLTEVKVELLLPRREPLECDLP